VDKPFDVLVQTADFNVDTELLALRQQSKAVGAMVNFIGVVRDTNDDQLVSAMELEHYPGMTERSIKDIIEQAAQRWDLIAAKVIHRVGQLLPGDQIVLVAVCSKHRGDAFQACEFIMDFLKTQAPFWKKEQTANGERWVDARSADNTALDKWL
jgi:molybdopterin synthase catalytic subunit